MTSVIPRALLAALLALLVAAGAQAVPDAKKAPADDTDAWMTFGDSMGSLRQKYPKTQIPPEEIIDAATKAGLDTTSNEFRDRLDQIHGEEVSQGLAPAGPPDGTPASKTPINGTADGGLAKRPPVNTSAPIGSGAQQVMIGVDNAALRANPGNVNALLRRGMDLSAAGNYRGAYDDLDKVVKNGNPSAQTLAVYGDAAYQLGDYRTAYQAATLALQLDPTSMAARSLQKFTEGREPAVRLPSALGELASNPSAGAMPPDGKSAAFPGSANSQGPGFAGAPPPSGMTAEQVAALARQAAAAGPDAAVRSGQFTKDAANAMRVRDYTTAYQLASQAIGLNPSNAQALNYRAMALSQMRRYSDAVQDASAALGLAPGSAAALQTRSWAFAKQGKYKESLIDAQATLERDPNNAYAYQNLAFARAGLGDREGALEALKRSAALDPRFQARLERAVQAPQDTDLTLLFDDGSAAPAAAVAAAPAPGARRAKFLRLAVLSASGGLLIALGVLHIVSASWREKMRLTVRRVLGPSPVAAGTGAVASGDGPGMGAFWTQYELVKEIGLGGMGVVYEAIDRSLERRVAVKKMRDEIRLDPADRQRFVAEARMVAQLHNPSIVDIYGIVEDGMDVYLVFEYVEGRTLQDELKAGGPMDVPRAARVIKEMASAVAHAHERGIIHRDLKPSNVMLTPEGRVKVMDFGIARQAKDVMTRHSMTNTIAGTPPYMAPEQEQGTVRKESDVYALGVCLYEMTTGHLPFTGSGAAMLLNKLNGKLIPPSQRSASLPPGLDAVIARALAPDPDKRYRTPAELVAALDALTSVDLAS